MCRFTCAGTASSCSGALPTACTPPCKVDPDWPQPKRSLNALNEKHRLFMERHMRSELADRPDLLEKVIPDYPAYGKRILIDNHWFRMLKRDNVDLITDPIETIVPEGVRMKDGRLWQADALVLATGFKVSKMLFPMKIFGREGRELHEVWGADDAKAYLGLTVPGFPNFFMLTGPNTALAHGGNQIFMTECSVRHMMLCVARTVGERAAFDRMQEPKSTRAITARSTPCTRAWCGPTRA